MKSCGSSTSLVEKAGLFGCLKDGSELCGWRVMCIESGVSALRIALLCASRICTERKTDST